MAVKPGHPHWRPPAGDPPGGNGSNAQLYAGLDKQQRQLVKQTYEDRINQYVEERAEGFLALIDRALTDPDISAETRAKLAITVLTRLPKPKPPKPDALDVHGELTATDYIDTE